MKFPIRLLETGFILAAIFFATAPFFTAATGAGDAAGGGALPLFRVIWAFIYLVVGIYALLHARRFASIFMDNKPILFLVLLAALSTLWSLDPQYTLRHSVTLLATTMTGAYFAMRYTPRQQARLVLIVLSLAILLSIVGELVAPNLLPPSVAVGPDPDDGAWHGIYAHKNIFGRIIALALIAYFSLYPRLQQRLWKNLLLLAFTGILLVKSHSASAVIVVFITIVSVRTSYLLRWTPKRIFYASTALGTSALTGLYLVATNLSAVTALVGKDATLTGRTTLWKLLLEQISMRPFLGFGFESFWVSEIAERIKGESFQALHAHNGYLDLLLSLGLAGLVLFLAAYAGTLRRVLVHFRKQPEAPSVDTLWPLSMLIFLFLCQLSESIFATWNPLFWMLFVTVSCSSRQLEPVHSVQRASSIPAHRLAPADGV
jgi:O-antigen ligase